MAIEPWAPKFATPRMLAATPVMRITLAGADPVWRGIIAGGLKWLFDNHTTKPTDLGNPAADLAPWR